MHRFVNGYLILYLLDATLSVLDDQLLLTGIDSPATPLRSAVASLTILYSIPIFWSLAFRPDIPKSVVLPLTTTLFWFALGGLPIPIYLGMSAGLGFLSAIQLGVGLLTLWRVRVLTGGRWFFDPETLPPQPLRIGSAVLFTLVAFLVTPLAVAFYGASMVPLAIEVATDGFLHVTPEGIHTRTRVYRKQDRIVHLVGMVHIGDRKFYDGVYGGFFAEDPVVLVEGVTDEHGLLHSDFSYKWVASILDLEAQGEGAGEASPFRRVWADVDVSELLPETLAFLNRIGAVLANDTLEGFLTALFLEFGKEQPSPDELRRISFDINERRSAHALEVLESELADSRVFLMAWGALHMPAFVDTLEDWGFDLVYTEDRRVISF